MYKILIISIFTIYSFNLSAQKDTISSEKKRLDFAKTYFELGGAYMPSFTGKRFENGTIKEFKHSASINQYLTWGAFHFWGHAEFYVTFPLQHNSISKELEADFELLHSTTTGARFYPWKMTENKIRPYFGLNWGAMVFKQIIKPDENQPTLSKDFMLNYETGITYNYKSLGARLGVNYFSDTKWDYPLNKSMKGEIKTPSYSVQLGLFYTFDASKSTKHKDVDEWNNFPKISKLSYNATTFGNLFIGAGPSLSYSLVSSEYNKTNFPYLTEKHTSRNYFDVAIGYQFNKANLFTALSFRNPTYETEGYGTKQTIKKNSLTLEINKYLTDYTGFAPYIGLNIAYDDIKYSEDDVV